MNYLSFRRVHLNIFNNHRLFLFSNLYIFWFIIFGWSGIAATFCPVIILTLFWDGYTEKGAIVSMIVGFLCVPIFKFIIPAIDGVGIYFDKLDVMLPSVLLATIAGVITSKLIE